MTNSQILSLLDQLRLEYSAATEERKKEIMAEQSKLKASIKRCAQCSEILADKAESLFCKESCRDEYWKPAKKSSTITSKQDLLDRMNELRKSMFKDDEFNQIKKIFV